MYDVSNNSSYLEAEKRSCFDADRVHHRQGVCLRPQSFLAESRRRRSLGTTARCDPGPRRPAARRPRLPSSQPPTVSAWPWPVAAASLLVVSHCHRFSCRSGSAWLRRRTVSAATRLPARAGGLRPEEGDGAHHTHPPTASGASAACPRLSGAPRRLRSQGHCPPAFPSAPTAPATP